LGEMPVVIPVISASGGVGKTTISLLLAYMLKLLTHEPKRILLIDLDPTAGLSLRVFGDEEYDKICGARKTLYHMDLDFGVKNVRIDDYVNFPGRYAEAIANVAVLPPGEDDRGDLASRIENWFEFARRERLVDLLESSGALSQYSHIIIDTAPFFDVRYTVVAVSTSERVVVPLRPTVTDIKRTERMLNTLRRLKYNVDPVFIFNFDKDKFVREATTLLDMGYKIPESGKRSKIIPELRKLIKDLEEKYGTIVKSALVHRKSLSDAEFPRSYEESARKRSKEEDPAVLACTPMVDLLKALSVNVAECPFEYEEE